MNDSRPTHATTPAHSAAYARLSSLPLVIERASCGLLELSGVTSFTRLTTTVELAGAGELGRGEDTTYFPDAQRAFAARFATLELTGEWTIDSFSQHVASLDLFPEPLAMDDHTGHRIWAFESAALDLALRQAGTNLASALGLHYEPVRFCISMGLGPEPSATKVQEWLRANPQLEFKLDCNAKWSEPLMRELADSEAVRVVDIKGQYTGDWIDNTPDPVLYERLARLLPDAFLEDAFLDDETTAALGEGGLWRLTWDAPVTSVDFVRNLELSPAAINIKPSRFGTLAKLLETIEWCQSEGIPLYGGGQFELGYGRSQAQELASIFYPNSANDVAPVAYHRAQPGDEVPDSPVLVPDGTGFGFDVE